MIFFATNNDEGHEGVATERLLHKDCNCCQLRVHCEQQARDKAINELPPSNGKEGMGVKINADKNEEQHPWSTALPGDDRTEYVLYVDKQAAQSATRRIAFIVLCALSVILSLPLSLVGPFFPTEAVRHDVTLVAAGFVLAMFPMAKFLSAPVSGILSPILGPKVLIIPGGSLLGISTAAFALVDIFQGNTFLIIGLGIRILQGVGSAASSTGSNALLARLFPEEIGRMSGILEVFACAGYMLGPLLGGILFHFGGFRLPFVVTGVVTLLTMVPLLWIIPRRDSAARGRSKVTVMKVMSAPGVVLVFTASVAGMSVFAFLDLVLQPELSEQGVTSTGVGFMFMLISIVYAVVAPLVGWASTPANAQQLIAFGMSLVAASLCVLGPAPVGFIPRALSLQCASLVFLSAGCSIVLIPVVPELVRLTQHLGTGSSDIVSGIIVASYSLGEIIGPIIGGFLLQFVGMSTGSSLFAAFIALIAILLVVIPAPTRIYPVSEEAEPILKKEALAPESIQVDMIVRC